MNLHNTAEVPQQFGKENPALSEARSKCPVFQEPSGVWTVTGYDDVQAVFKDVEGFSSDVLRMPEIPEEFRGRLPENFMRSFQMNLDPPHHQVVRRTVSKAFTGRRMKAMEPKVRAIVNELIDEMADKKEAELMSAFAYRVMSQVVPAMIGLTNEEVQDLHDLVDVLFYLLMDAGSFGPLEASMSAEDIEANYTDSARTARFERMCELWENLSRFLERRESDPQDDLASAMLATKADDGSPGFTKDEIIVHMVGLLAAAGETTGNLIGTMVVLFDQNPDQLALLRSDPSLIANAVEEALRKRAIPGVAMRKSTKDRIVGGVTIPAGAAVGVSLESIAHDTCRFANPDKFDITRPNAAEHMTFGHGAHLCLGAPLARLTTAAAIETLYDRLPGLRLKPGSTVGTAPVANRAMVLSVDVEWD